MIYDMYLYIEIYIKKREQLNCSLLTYELLTERSSRIVFIKSFADLYPSVV